MTAVSLWQLDPATYEPHLLHRPDRSYGQTNCYVDVVVELLHARGDEPLALMACALDLDFEGDQFTFFKPSLDDIRDLFGVDIHEMQPYRPLGQQVDEQLRRGRTVIVETDSWFLPDTSGISYRQQHVKSSIAFEAIDVDSERAHYFHNGGLYALEGEDYRGALRVDVTDASSLPPYAELVRFDAGQRLTDEALRAASRGLLARTMARRVVNDPFPAFGAWMSQRLPELVECDPDAVADVVFATARMAGSAAAVAASYLTWLDSGFAHAADALEQVAAACTTLSFKLARRRAFDPEPLLEQMSTGWSAAGRSVQDLLQ